MYKNTKLLCLVFFCVFSLGSCSKDSITEGEDAATKTVDLVDNFAYSEIEIEILTAVNNYRKSKGLYMVEKNVVNHDNFNLRYNALVQEIGAKSVSENIGYGYGTAGGVVKAWIDSEGHRKNIEGDFTHFGISVEKDASGKNYFTNIFVKR
jgi:hypothetical protein